MLSTIFKRKVNKNLSKKNLRTITFGGVYRVAETNAKNYMSSYARLPYYKKYGYFVPMHIEENGEHRYYMVDTFQLPKEWYKGKMSGPKTTYNTIVDGLERMDDVNYTKEIYKENVFQFCESIIEITDKNIHIWELDMDIHNYIPNKCLSARGYYRTDVRPFIRFYHNQTIEDPYGLCLTKKGAKPCSVIPLYKTLETLNINLKHIEKDCVEYKSCVDYISNNRVQLNIDGFDVTEVQDLLDFYNNLNNLYELSKLKVENYKRCIDDLFTKTFYPVLRDSDGNPYNFVTKYKEEALLQRKIVYND